MKVLAVNIWNKKTKDSAPRQSAVDWWRIKSPYQELAKHTPIQVDFSNSFVTENTEEEWNKLKGYDVIVTSYMDNLKTYAWVKAMCTLHHVKHIMDLDDNIFEVDEMNPVYLRFSPGSEASNNVIKILQDVDYVTVSTPYLKERLGKVRSKPIFIAPNQISREVYKYDPRSVPEHKEIVIGYQGSSTHHRDVFNTGFIWAIRSLLKKHDNLKFAICGGILSDLEKYLPQERIIKIDGSPDFFEWTKIWQKLPYDIGVAPLQQTSFNRGKSAIKYYEYALRMIPGVYTFHDPYYNSVHENRTGFLASDEMEWEAKLGWLITNETLRKTMAQNAYMDVINNHSLDRNWKIWENILNEVQ